MAQNPSDDGQVTIPVPAGMTPEQYKKLVGTFTKAYEGNKAKGEADKAAYKILLKKYAPELLKLRNEARRTKGLPLVGAKA